MKIAFGAAAAVLLAIIGLAMPAAAQTPGGTYLQSCSGIERRGDTLVATCRNRDGAGVRSALDGVGHCAGDIGNNNGVLHCQTRDGRQASGHVIGGPERGERERGERERGPAYGAAPGYPAPGYREGREREGGFEHCRQLQEEAQRLRYRLNREWDPRDRERISYRLREIRAEEERCRR